MHGMRIKGFRCACLSVALLCMLPMANLFAAVDQARLQQDIQRLVASLGENLNIGIQVRSLATGKILYQQNADRIFVPASTLKLFTATAALTYLNPNYRFQTTVLAKTRAIENGVLNSDVYFKFDGDPTLERKDFEALVTALR